MLLVFLALPAFFLDGVPVVLNDLVDPALLPLVQDDDVVVAVPHAALLQEVLDVAPGLGGQEDDVELIDQALLLQHIDHPVVIALLECDHGVEEVELVGLLEVGI